VLHTVNQKLFLAFKVNNNSITVTFVWQSF
jgi:hypothetical protein